MVIEQLEGGSCDGNVGIGASPLAELIRASVWAVLSIFIVFHRFGYRNRCKNRSINSCLLLFVMHVIESNELRAFCCWGWLGWAGIG